MVHFLNKSEICLAELADQSDLTHLSQLFPFFEESVDIKFNVNYFWMVVDTVWDRKELSGDAEQLAVLVTFISTS